MKKSSRLIICLMFTFVLMMSSGCKKEKNTITEYIGTVVEENTMSPLSNIMVSVTDGIRVVASTMTDETGSFSFSVNFEKVTESDSLLLDGSPFLPYQKKFALKGMGQEQYNYGTLILGNELKTFQYAGAMYYVHPEIGEMTWEAAMAFCENLTYAGYSDWFLPDKDELNAMYVYNDDIGGFVTYNHQGSYWSSTTTYYFDGLYYHDDRIYYWYLDFSTGRSNYETNQDVVYHRVRPIRKDNGKSAILVDADITIAKIEQNSQLNNNN